jgi:hypothetical protein
MPRLYLPFLLLILGLALRAVKSTPLGVDLLPNFSPWLAITLTGAALAAPRQGWWWAFAAIVVMDALVLGGQWLAMPATFIPVYACLFLVAWWGRRLRERGIGSAGLLGAAAVSSVGFFIVTSALTWAVTPEYPLTLAGLAQALTVGLPGYPPAWTFLRNALLSDLGFTLLILASARIPLPAALQRPSPNAVRSVP